MAADRLVVCAPDMARALRRHGVLPGVDVLAVGGATGARYGLVVVLAPGLTEEQWGWVRTLARPDGRVRDCGGIEGLLRDVLMGGGDA